jgi:uncharacterized protein YbaP (TraB family)
LVVELDTRSLEVMASADSEPKVLEANAKAASEPRIKIRMLLKLDKTLQARGCEDFRKMGCCQTSVSLFMAGLTRLLTLIIQLQLRIVCFHNFWALWDASLIGLTLVA